VKFTFDEWGKIKHALEVVRGDYEKQMLDSKPSNEKLSMYQIFKSQMVEIDGIIEKILNAEI